MPQTGPSLLLAARPQEGSQGGCSLSPWGAGGARSLPGKGGGRVLAGSGQSLVSERDRKHLPEPGRQNLGPVFSPSGKTSDTPRGAGAQIRAMWGPTRCRFQPSSAPQFPGLCQGHYFADGKVLQSSRGQTGRSLDPTLSGVPAVGSPAGSGPESAGAEARGPSAPSREASRRKL